MSDEDYTEGAYVPVVSFACCQVAEVCEPVVEGDLDIANHPGWAYTDSRDGAPSDEIRMCADALTQRNVESTDGKRRAG